MIFTGEFSEDLKEKAIREANKMLAELVIGNPKKLFKYTQLSWRIKKNNLFFKVEKKPSELFIPGIESYEIEQINFHTPVMIDVFVKLGDIGVYRIRMVAEKRPYKTDPEAMFRYNPNSLRRVEN